MKKILTLVLAFSAISYAGFSQGNGKGKGKAKKHKTEQWADRDDRWDDDDRYESRKGQKQSKNAPAKVRAAFNRDYPNATNVTWTKDRGYWTANFGSGLFARNNTATYKANGTRMDASNSTGIFGNNGETKEKRKRTMQERLPF